MQLSGSHVYIIIVVFNFQIGILSCVHTIIISNLDALRPGQSRF